MRIYFLYFILHDLFQRIESDDINSLPKGDILCYETVVSSLFFLLVNLSVADPAPYNPYVFGPPGSGSVSQRYGSGSFYHQAKIVENP
jgi:hypothetical protein